MDQDKKQNAIIFINADKYPDSQEEINAIREKYSKPIQVPSKELAKAIFIGLKEIGIKGIFRNGNIFKEADFEPCDYGIVWGARKQTLINTYKNNGVPVLVLDIGTIKRNENYMYMGVNGVAKLPNLSIAQLPGFSPENRAKEMGLIAGTTQQGNQRSPIYIFGQMPGDVQHTITDMNVWVSEVAAKLKMVSNRRIIYRPHPWYKEALPSPKELNVDEIRTHEKESLDKALNNAFVMVTHNSSAAYEAMIAGCPVICHRNACYASGALSGDEVWTALAEAGNARTKLKPSKNDIQNVLNQVACSNWNVSEIMQGIPFEFFDYELNLNNEVLKETRIKNLLNENVRLRNLLIANRIDF